MCILTLRSLHPSLDHRPPCSTDLCFMLWYIFGFMYNKLAKFILPSTCSLEFFMLKYQEICLLLLETSQNAHSECRWQKLVHFFWVSPINETYITKPNIKLLRMLHSRYWYFIWEWRFHSITAATGFPLRDKITGGYPIIMKFYREG